MSAIKFDLPQAAIANGASLSGKIDLGGKGAASALVGISMPSAWTTANLTFQVSHDDEVYQDLYDDAGTEVTVVAAASRFIRIIPSLFAGIRFIKVRSGTSGAAVAQGAARTLMLVVREV